MTAKPLKKGATYDDLVRVPENFVAEMFDGELYASPRPALPHTRAAGVLLGKLGGSFDEVLSPSTEYIDRRKKLRIYAREGVPHAWLVDPLRQSLEVLALESGSLEQIEEHQGVVRVRARPFDAVELELRALWS